METILNKLDKSVGIEMDSGIVNNIAYADDVVLLARTTSGLQHLLDVFNRQASKANLEINVSKTKVLSIVALGKVKKVVVRDPKLKVGNIVLNLLYNDSSIKYMGINFNSYGILKSNIISDLTELLNKLNSSYMKPQQKLWILRNCVFGKLAFRLPLTDLSVGLLNQLNIRTRKFVREIIHLPHDTPRAFYHTKVCDGGIGIFNFRLGALLNRRNRVNNSMKDFDRDMMNCYANVLAKIDKFLRMDDIAFNSKILISNYFKQTLYNSNVGRDLSLANSVPSQNKWLDVPNGFISGRDFINYVKLRVNTFPSRVCVSRGDQMTKICSSCKSKTETTYHEIHGCLRTHGLRVKRHSVIVEHVAKINKRAW